MSETNNNNTEVAVTKSVVELDLFQFSSPKPGMAILVKERKNDDGKVTGVAMVLPTRKSLATQMGLPSKDSAVSGKLREASDLLLNMGLAEFQQGLRENKITGARFAKSATGRLTLSAIPVENRTVSQEQLKAAYMAMSPEERAAFMEGLKNAANSPQQNGMTIEAEVAKTNEQPPTDEVPALDQASELPEATAE